MYERNSSSPQTKALLLVEIICPPPTVLTLDIPHHFNSFPEYRDFPADHNLGCSILRNRDCYSDFCFPCVNKNDLCTITVYATGARCIILFIPGKLGCNERGEMTMAFLFYPTMRSVCRDPPPRSRGTSSIFKLIGASRAHLIWLIFYYEVSGAKSRSA